MRSAGRLTAVAATCAALVAGAAGCGDSGDDGSGRADREQRLKGIQPPPNAISPNVRISDGGRDLSRDAAVDALTGASGPAEPVTTDPDDPLSSVSGTRLDGALTDGPGDDDSPG